MAATNYDNNVRQLTNIADAFIATRITDKSSTLINLIYTNCPERVVSSGVTHINISDHSLVYEFRRLSINFRKGHTSITCRNFKTFNRSCQSFWCNDICNETELTRTGNFWIQLLTPTKCGQSGKPNFYKLSTNMLRFGISALDLKILLRLLLI